MAASAHAQEPTSVATNTSTDPAPSRAQQLMGDIDPKLAELTDKVLYGDI